MTEKPRKEQSVSEYIAQLTYQRFEEFLREREADRPRDELLLRDAQHRYDKAKTQLEKRLASIELMCYANDFVRKAETVWLLNLIAMGSESVAMMTREPKPTQAEQDELKAKAVAIKKDSEEYLAKLKKDFDEHLAKRLAKIYDTKGHEAVYGASRNE